MRRAFRHVFTILTVLSLVLCVATVVAWARSWWCCDHTLLHDSRTRRLDIYSAPGRIWLSLDVCSSDSDVQPLLSFESTAWGSPVFTQPGSILGHQQIGAFLPPMPEPWMHGGFGVYHQDWADTHATYAAACPLWFLMLITICLPVLAVRDMVRRRRRAMLGRCRQCGYDLRATPDRCPECGAVLASSAASGQ